MSSQSLAFVQALAAMALMAYGLYRFDQAMKPWGAIGRWLAARRRARMPLGPVPPSPARARIRLGELDAATARARSALEQLPVRERSVLASIHPAYDRRMAVKLVARDRRRRG